MADRITFTLHSVVTTLISHTHRIKNTPALASPFTAPDTDTCLSPRTFQSRCATQPTLWRHAHVLTTKCTVPNSNTNIATDLLIYTWYMICHNIIWYDIWYIWYTIYDMIYTIWYVICHDIWYDTIYDTIYNMIYDIYIIYIYHIWYMIYDICDIYVIIYDMLYIYIYETMSWYIWYNIYIYHIWYVMICHNIYDTIWYIWYTIYDIYDMWYDMS